jgi:hypothetical protein
MGESANPFAPTLDVDTICQYAAEDTLDGADVTALKEQVRRLLGADILGWYVRIQGRDEMQPLTLHVVTRRFFGSFGLAERKRSARVIRIGQLAGIEEMRRPLPSRPLSWRRDRLSAVALTLWFPAGTFDPAPYALVLEEEVRQYPPKFDPDYTLVDMLADFADAVTLAFAQSGAPTVPRARASG